LLGNDDSGSADFNCIVSKTKITPHIPTIPLPLKPRIMTKGFNKNEWSRNTGIIKIIINLKFSDILIFLLQLGQTLFLPNVFNVLEKNLFFARSVVTSSTFLSYLTLRICGARCLRVGNDLFVICHL
jgi:hypothetical protein